MTVCNVPGCQEHYGCHLRAKGISISQKATPNRVANMSRRVAPPMQQPSWEAGTKTVTAPNGIERPLLGANLQPLPIKQYHREHAKWDRLTKQAHGGN